MECNATYLAYLRKGSMSFGTHGLSPSCWYQSNFAFHFLGSRVVCKHQMQHPYHALNRNEPPISCSKTSHEVDGFAKKSKLKFLKLGDVIHAMLAMHLRHPTLRILRMIAGWQERDFCNSCAGKRSYYFIKTPWP